MRKVKQVIFQLSQIKRFLGKEYFWLKKVKSHLFYYKSTNFLLFKSSLQAIPFIKMDYTAVLQQNKPPSVTGVVNMTQVINHR